MNHNLKTKVTCLKTIQIPEVLECLNLHGFKDVNYGVTEVYLQFTN